MVTYEVQIELDPALAESFVTYMRRRHIPDVLGTGCFTGAHFEKTAEGVYRTRYIALTREDLDRYLLEHAAAMRGDFATHFPTGAASRLEWDLIQEWP